MTPDELEQAHTLLTATGRFEELRRRALDRDPTEEEALELLALAEVIGRKVGYGRQLDVRAARRAGASWRRIGDALGTTEQAAREAHRRWVDEQEAQHASTGYEGLDPDEARAERDLADGG